MNLTNRRSLLASLALALTSSIALALEPNLEKPKLVEYSTHVVTGTVIEVFERERVVNDRHRTDGLDAHYVFEVLIDSVEKGAGLRKGEVVYARARSIKRWSTDRDPMKRFCGSAGARFVPRVDDHVRLYLRRDALGEYRPLTPNGYEKLE